VRWAESAERAAGSDDVPASPRTDQTGQIQAADLPIGGGVWTGVGAVVQSPYLLGICLFIWLYATVATLLYFEQVEIVERTIGRPEARTTLFAYMDLAVNALAFLGQLLVTGRIIARWGLPVALAITPMMLAVGFVVLGLSPVLGVLVVFQVLLRSGTFALVQPAREVLFTVVAREEKYKSKNFIDTVVHRGGDMLCGWLRTGLAWLGLGLSAIAFVAVAVAALWMATGVLLGRKHEQLREERSSRPARAESRAST
jgi:AAA family ATP:ADP antiporter